MEEAAAAGDVCAVKVALESLILHHDDGLSLQQRISPGSDAVIRRSFLMAVQGGYLGVLRLLLNAGANPDGDVIRAVATSGSCETLDVFYQHGWDINKAYLTRFTPLYYALDSVQATQWLLEHGAAPNASISEASQLHPIIVEAAWRHSPAVVRLLLQHGANPRTERLLHSAAAASNPSFAEVHPERSDPDRVEVLQILLEAGADVNDMEPDPKGRPLRGMLSRRRTMESGTPLHAAVGAENIRTVRFLLEHGADPQAPSWSGHSPLQVAVSHKQEDIAELLKSWKVESAEKMSEKMS